MRSNNSLLNVLTPKTQASDKYTRSGAYKLTYPDCHKAYVGQTSRSFTQRFKEHKNAFKFSRNNSNYAKHALTHSHSFGPIHTTMQVLQYQNKEAHLNTIERYFIYKEFSRNNGLNDEHNISPTISLTLY
jgi:RNA-splicing ligase RtcB